MSPARLDDLEQVWMAICELANSSVVSNETRTAAVRLKRLLELELAAYHLINDSLTRNKPAKPPDAA